jgi:hypothetical protein
MILNKESFETSGNQIRGNHGPYYLLNLNVLEEFQSIFAEGTFDVYRHIDKLETNLK